MVSVSVTPGLAGFKAIMKQIAEEGLLVDVFLKTYPMVMNPPADIEAATKGVRIIQVTDAEGC